MKKEELRIVFMGTPEFAVASLRRLVEGGYNVVAVVTQPDKPVGRHQEQLQPSQVKQYAVAHGIPVLQPVKMKDHSMCMPRCCHNTVVQHRLTGQLSMERPRRALQLSFLTRISIQERLSCRSILPFPMRQMWNMSMTD